MHLTLKALNKYIFDATPFYCDFVYLHNVVERGIVNIFTENPITIYNMRTMTSID